MRITFSSLSHEESGTARDWSFASGPVSLGSGASCELRLAHWTVSALHATVLERGGHWLLRDEGGKNGTWVAGTRVRPGRERLLRNGDHMRLGAVYLEFRVALDPLPKDTTTADLALRLVSMGLAADASLPVVRVVEGPDLGRVLPLMDGPEYTIGRHPKSDLPLTDPAISKEHAVVTRRGPVIRIADLGAKHGVVVGDERLEPRTARRWRSVLAARLGDTVLVLELPGEAGTTTEAVLEQFAEARAKDRVATTGAAPVAEMPSTVLPAATTSEGASDEPPPPRSPETPDVERATASVPAQGTGSPIAPTPAQASARRTGEVASSNGELVWIAVVVFVGVVAVVGIVVVLMG